MFNKSNHFLFALVFLLTLILVPVKTHASTSRLVIDEFKISSEGNLDDEYIILANYGTKSIDLNDYLLSKVTYKGGDDELFSFKGIYIDSNEKILLAHPEYSGERNYEYHEYSGLIAPNNIIILYDANGIIVDAVAFGKFYEGVLEGVLGYETLPLANPETGEIYRRINGVDTNNNLDDFEKVVQKALIDINADKILITEMLPNPEDGVEWFELYNPTNIEISLSGLKICDGAGRTHCYSFGKNDFLAPFEYKTYEQSITKITLNNDGDWLELYGDEEAAISSSNENFGESDKDNSFALFGSMWMWTSTPTKALANVFTDIIEIEPVKAVKKSVKKISIASKKVTSTTNTTKSSEEQTDSQSSVSNDTEVKGDIVSASDQIKKNKISQETVGYCIMGLAIAVLLGYTLWENKERLSEFIKRISRKND